MIKTAAFKKKRAVTEAEVLEFLSNIESGWRGYERFAFWLIRQIKPKVVVDLGFDRGISTIAFAFKNKGQVFGIDWFEEKAYASKCFALDAAFRNVSNAIRLQYAKNINLIVGPFQEIAKKWDRKIDVLHIDWAHSYEVAKQHFEIWKIHLNPKAVILVHDIMSFPKGTGQFFNELCMPKHVFSHGAGLGIASFDTVFIEALRDYSGP